MSDPADELAGIEAAIRDLIPELSDRLDRHGLGEIEVRRGELRVRVVAPPHASRAEPDALATGPATVIPVDSPAHPHPAPPPQVPGRESVSSPAVGYFVFGDGLGPGLEVQSGDPLGYVEVLGVRHDVRAPRSGVVRNLVTETGEAVEYGQLLIELEAVDS
jgi:acetyl-CoA carboxylase biotin carboxyl carrier protein